MIRYVPVSDILGRGAMTKVAIWCRHKGDNIIGIGPHIPWHVKSDFRRFRRITTGQALAAGQKTYESFPGRTLPDRRIFVLTPEENYEVSDPEKHFVVNDVRFSRILRKICTLSAERRFTNCL